MCFTKLIFSMMRAKCFVFFVIYSQLCCRSCFANDAKCSQKRDNFDDYENQIRNFTQNAINTTLNDMVTIFNDSISETLDDRKNIADKINKGITKYPVNNDWGKWFGWSFGVGTGICNNTTAKDCCDDVDSIKQQIDKLKNCSKNLLSGASSGCSTSDTWLDCKPYTDVRTNAKKVLAVPKQTSEKTANWQNAVNICAKYGANLVIIDSAQKQQFIKDSYSQLSNENIWVGATRNAPETTVGAYRWLDGTPLTYTNFAPGEPNNFQGVERCIDINHQWCSNNPCNYPPFSWNDADCSWFAFVLCEFTLSVDSQC